MDKIVLNQLIPSYFDEGKIHDSSEVWGTTLTINRGESYLVKANSGRGKSSLCSFLYGIRSDYNGSIAFDQRDIASFSVNEWVECRKNSLSLLFQDLRLFGELTVMENIELKNRLTNFKHKDEIISSLEALGVGSKLYRRAGELSLGEQQRVAFVRALCQPFDFIILDEPVSHLDGDNGAIMAEMVASEALRQGAGVITTSVGNNLELQYDNILCL